MLGEIKLDAETWMHDFPCQSSVWISFSCRAMLSRPYFLGHMSCQSRIWNIQLLLKHGLFWRLFISKPLAILSFHPCFFCPKNVLYLPSFRKKLPQKKVIPLKNEGFGCPMFGIFIPNTLNMGNFFTSELNLLRYKNKSYCIEKKNNPVVKRGPFMGWWKRDLSKVVGHLRRSRIKKVTAWITWHRVFTMILRFYGWSTFPPPPRNNGLITV